MRTRFTHRFISRPTRWPRPVPAIHVVILLALFALAAPASAENIVDLGTLDGTQGFTLSNDVPGFGRAFRVGGAIGDVNNDGFQDFAWNGNDSGSGQPIYVIFGRPGGFPGLLGVSQLNGSNGFVLSDLSSRLQAAESVEAAGDLNGDGIDDFVVGANSRNSAFDSVGFVVYGRQGAFPATVDFLDLDGGNGFRIDDYSVWPTGNAFDVFLRAAGDINGDGHDDLFVGLPDADSEPQDASLVPGAAFVIYGRSTDFPAVFDLDAIDGSNGFLIPPTPESFDELRQDFARSGGYVGDVNGDGRDDFAVGIPFAEGQPGVDGGFGIGRVEVVYGRAGNFSASLDLDGLSSNESFTVLAAGPDDDVGDLGWSLTDLGDFDGDGYDDVLIGSPLSSPPGPDEEGNGAAYVVYGASTTNSTITAGTSGGPRVTAMVPIQFEAPFDEEPEPVPVATGLDVAAGDVNGDGLPDAVIGNGGSTTVDGRSSAGVSFVVFGRQNQRPGAVDLHDLDVFQGYRIIGEAAADFSGLSIDAADVAGGDGRADVLLGGEGLQDDPDGSLIGAVHVVLGGSQPGIFADGFETGDSDAWDAVPDWVAGSGAGYLQLGCSSRELALENQRAASSAREVTASLR